MTTHAGITWPTLRDLQYGLICGCFLVSLWTAGAAVAEEPVFAPESAFAVISEAAGAPTTASLATPQLRRAVPVTQAPDINDYRPVPELGTEPRVWVLVSEPGRLELRDSRMRLLASEHSERPVLHSALVPETDAFERIFFLRFEASRGLTGTQRIVRARPDRDTYRILRRNTDGRDGWYLLDVEPDEFEQVAEGYAAARELSRRSTEEDLDQELAALLEWEVVQGAAAEPSLSAEDQAFRLREEGMERLGRGDYAGALDRLEESLRLLPDARLADRVERLRAYLRLRGL